MARVLYLCRGPESSDRLYFASELPEGYFSPGLLIIQGQSVRGNIFRNYRFAARQGEQELDLELAASETGRAFVVDAGANGKFYFKAVAMSRGLTYAGQLDGMEKGKPIFRLEPANMRQLEQACRDFDFYFVGFGGA